jgi:hypothetical protein
MTMSDAVLFSLVDAIRVCVCEWAGRLVLLRIQKWEDRLQFPGGQRRDWKRAKMFMFTIANTFGAIIIMVGYRAFAQGLYRLGFRVSGFSSMIGYRAFAQGLYRLGFRVSGFTDHLLCRPLMTTSIHLQVHDGRLKHPLVTT